MSGGFGEARWLIGEEANFIKPGMNLVREVWLGRDVWVRGPGYGDILAHFKASDIPGIVVPG